MLSCLSSIPQVLQSRLPFMTYLPPTFPWQPQCSKEWTPSSNTTPHTMLPIYMTTLYPSLYYDLASMLYLHVFGKLWNTFVQWSCKFLLSTFNSQSSGHAFCMISELKAFYIISVQLWTVKHRLSAYVQDQWTTSPWKKKVGLNVM